MTTTVAMTSRSGTAPAAKTAPAPANQDLEAKAALTAATAQAVLSELSEILTTEASTSSPAAAKPAEVEAAEASVTPAHLPADASALFARNHYNFLSAFWDKEAGKPVLDEEIGNAIRLTQGGKVVNERLLG